MIVLARIVVRDATTYFGSFYDETFAAPTNNRSFVPSNDKQWGGGVDPRALSVTKTFPMEHCTTPARETDWNAVFFQPRSGQDSGMIR